MNDFEVRIECGKTRPLEVEDKTFKSVFDWDLSENELKKAANELSETEEKRKECLRELKEKLSKVPTVRFRQDDFYLLRFLRVRKYDVSRAYQNLKIFFEQRKKNPEFFLLPPDLKITQEINWSICLPYVDEEGRIIFLLNFSRWDPHERTFEEMYQTALTVADLVSMNPKCQVNGVIGIYDMSGMTARHVAELLWKGRLWSCLSITQNGYPWRIKKLIVINTNRFVRFLYNILKPLLQRKVVERCFLLGSDMNELHQHVNPVLLPKRLNGNLEEEECDVTQHVLDNLPYLRYERSFVFD